MEREFVSADSKGFMGALSPLLCISFELHNNRAIGGDAGGKITTAAGGGSTRISGPSARLESASGTQTSRPKKASGM